MRKMGIGFVILLLCGFLLSGCSGKANDGTDVKNSQGVDGVTEGIGNVSGEEDGGNDGGSGEIQIANFIGVMPMYLNASISAFNGDHGESKVKQCYETLSGEDLWKRVSADFVQGEGPDLICMSAGDERIRTLWEKGLLANLDDYVSADVKEMIFPGILQSGSVDGNWVGLAWEGMPWVLVTSNTLWKDEHWDLCDVERIVQEHPEMETLFVNADFYLTKGESSPEVNARFLFGNVEKYVDRERGTCDFENEEFIAALKLLKQFGEAAIPKEELPAYIKGGRNLATFMRFNYPRTFTETLQNYNADQCHFVGMVGQESAVGEWTNVMLILVNGKVKHPDAVREFLKLLLEYDHKGSTDMALAVREDVIRSRVRWDDSRPEWDGGPGWVYVVGKNEDGYSSFLPFSGPNGENLVEDYIALLRNLGPYPVDDSVAEIVEEEVENYMGSNKSAEETARTIQNRVQLYLSEQ